MSYNPIVVECEQKCNHHHIFKEKVENKVVFISNILETIKLPITW